MAGKRKWLFVPIVCLPYIVLGSLLLIFFSPNLLDGMHWLTEYLFTLGIEESQVWTGVTYGFYLFLLAIILLCVQCVQVSLLAFGLSLGQRWDAVSLAKTVMIIKMLLIPAYIVIFVLGAIMAVTIWLFVLSFAFVILDAIIIALTGGFGAVAVFHAYKAGMISQEKALLLGILQFVYCVDVVAAVILFQMLKKAKTDALAPLETIVG